MDWTNPKDKIAQYFTIKEALFLPTWNRMASTSDGLNDKYKSNLLKTFTIMDKIRVFLGQPIIVNVAYRPPVYNQLIGGAKKSAHMFGLAVDFHVPGMSCDEVRKKLLPKLAEFRIRMEDLPGSNWVHIDARFVPPGGLRFFKP